MGNNNDPTESEILYQALVSCGDDYGTLNDVVGGRPLYEFINITPVTRICDLLALKLRDLGYRVTKQSEKPKTRRIKNAK